MKILAWNLDCKSGQGDNVGILLEQSADVLLLQEVRKATVDDLRSQGYGCVWREVGGTRKWGSLVAAKAAELTEILIPAHQGWVSAARAVSENREFTFVSLHAKLVDIGGFVVPHLRSIFEQVHDLAETGVSLIVGGDFNSARLYDQIYPANPDNAKHEKFFQYLEDHYGLVSATYEIQKKEIQSFRGRSKYAYQNDHIVVPRDLVNRITKAEVLESEAIKLASDHNPVVVELG